MFDLQEFRFGRMSIDCCPLDEPVASKMSDDESVGSVGLGKHLASGFSAKSSTAFWHLEEIVSGVSQNRRPKTHLVPGFISRCSSVAFFSCLRRDLQTSPDRDRNFRFFDRIAFLEAKTVPLLRDSTVLGIALRSLPRKAKTHIDEAIVMQEPGGERDSIAIKPSRSCCSLEYEMLIPIACVRDSLRFSRRCVATNCDPGGFFCRIGVP